MIYYDIKNGFSKCDRVKYRKLTYLFVFWIFGFAANISNTSFDIIKMFLKNMFNSPIKKKKRVLHFNKNYVGAAEVLLRDRQFSNGFKIFFSFYQKQPAANVAFSRLVILLIVENRFIK